MTSEMSRYIDLEKYHLNERKHPFYEEMLAEIVSEIRKHIKDKTTSVLELGAGTGITTYEIAKLPVEITALELDANCCSFLKSNTSKLENVKVVQGDMVTFKGSKKFDVIVSVFSHDHVAYDKRKDFSKNLKNNLKSGGVYIMGDELIPKFKSESERQNSLKTYHNFIIQKAISEGNKELAELEKDALYSGLNKIGDFKRHEEMIEEEMKCLEVAKKKKIGPNKKVGGVFVYVFRESDKIC